MTLVQGRGPDHREQVQDHLHFLYSQDMVAHDAQECRRLLLFRLVLRGNGIKDAHRHEDEEKADADQPHHISIGECFTRAGPRHPRLCHAFSAHDARIQPIRRTSTWCPSSATARVDTIATPDEPCVVRGCKVSSLYLHDTHALANHPFATFHTVAC